MPWYAWIFVGIMVPVLLGAGVAFGPFLWECAKQTPRLLKEKPLIAVPFLLCGTAAAIITNNAWFFFIGVGAAFLAGLAIVILAALAWWFLFSLIARR